MSKLTENEKKIINKIWEDVNTILNDSLNSGLINSEAFRKIKTNISISLNHFN